MKILLVCDVYPPEVSSAANLMQELALGLAQNGHEVSVVTSFPRHYVSEASSPAGYKEYAQEGGVSVVRVKTLPHHKVNFIVRGFSQLLLPYLFFRKVKRYIKELDSVIVYSPPLPLGIMGGWVKRRYGARMLLNIQDLFPQNAIDLGVLRPRNLLHKTAIFMFEWMEQVAYRMADVITFHSEGGRKFLIEKKSVPASKTATLHNWIDLKQFETAETGGRSFRKEWGLEGKFVILFAGIMGPAQGLEFVVEAGRGVKDLQDLVFLFVGDGMEKSRIEEKVREYGLTNLIIKPFVSKEQYPHLVKEMDAGLVCLSAKNKTSFVPGKFLGYLAAGKPVLAFLNKESDGFALMEEAQCGMAIEATDAALAVKALREMYARRGEMKSWGDNGYKYAEAHLSLEACVAKVEELLK